MNITKFRKINKGKYKVYLDNGQSISLYEDVIIKNNLLIHKKVNEELLDKIKKENKEMSIYNIAINYISTKYRSEKEVTYYLNTKKASSFVISKTISRLKKEGYIDDLKFAKAYVNDQMKLSTSGPYKIKTMLLKYGICEDIVTDIMEEIDEESIRKKLSNLMEKQIKLKKGSLNMIKFKLLNYFINLGYDRDMILKTLDSCTIETDFNYLKKEYDKLYNKYSRKYEGESLKRCVVSKLYSKGYSLSEINTISVDTH